MKLNCIACGHNFQVDDAYDDYEGPVRCWVCGALLEIKAIDGSLRRMGLYTPPVSTKISAEPARNGTAMSVEA
jgi:hypothetical protein